ncbi:hypothetical protein JX580_07060 [Thiomicrospira microaerophila]|uniref:hypothetical protein n=1 Tax=Thiomicrospira microaerophila TaxID=406020 RepID=UPI00200CC662|nr:hypothetical protein [Thiomicrospira microaerophila]UQB41446.1 hypothetical protein JX580_07060 [Thiomicrospira microaerophila]
MIKQWLTGLAFLMVFPFVQAQSLQPITFEDQHGEVIQLDSSVKWAIFSHHNKGAKMTKEAIDQSGINDFARHQGVYIADISRMPALVTRMFAMPAMRKYPFKMALDREGQLTQNLPRQDEKVTLIRLDNLTIVETQFVDSSAVIEAFINANYK